MLELFFPSFLCLENRIFISGRNRFRTVHSSANWNWKPSQHVRAWSAKAGDAVPSGKRALTGGTELGWSVPCGSVLPSTRRTWPCSCPSFSKHLTRWVVEVLNYFDEQLPFDLGKRSVNVSKPSSLMWISSSGRDRWLLFCSRALPCEVGNGILMSSPEWEKHFLPPGLSSLATQPQSLAQPAPHHPWRGKISLRLLLSPKEPLVHPSPSFSCGLYLSWGCLSLDTCLKQDCFGFSYSSELMFAQKASQWLASSLVSVSFLTWNK